MKEFDFYISNNGRLVIPEYDINYLIDIKSSTIPSMPEANESTVKVAGRDGDFVLSTTYEALNFNIVCYTEDNLTPEEKREEELKINNFLHSIKNKTKVFGIQKENKFYNVKYSGALVRTNYPKHLEFSIPLKSSTAYGYLAEEKELIGNSEIVSDTVTDVGAVITINGPAITPEISLNDYSMEFGADLLEGTKLIIDSSKSTVTHISSSGIKANAMKYYNHQFPKIKKGTNQLKILSGIDDESQVKIEWYDYVL